jgi:hypothetical protein
MTAVLRTVVAVALISTASCARDETPRHFATAEEAAGAFIDTVKGGKLEDLLAFLGPEGGDIVSSSDPATGRRNQEVFVVAAAQKWHLEDHGANTKELIVGNEEWPFPIPLVKDERGWRFDAAAGKEEVISRRIGRNELSVISICRAYVAAQRAYARAAHDGKPAGTFAGKLKSDPGTQNGLFWPVKTGAPRSPLGELVAAAASDGEDLAARKDASPFHGYYFRMLAAQAGAAPALVAWPAQYDSTGVMTFVVGPDGAVFERDLGADTPAAAKAITRFEPDQEWKKTGTN